MGFWRRLFGADSDGNTDGPKRAPRKAMVRQINPEPLTYQLRRIAGGMTPEMVSTFLEEANRGDIYNLVDLANDARQKDLHLQAILATREDAVSALQWNVTEPVDATPKEQEVTHVIRNALLQLDANAAAYPGSLSLGGMIEHLQAANYFGFSCIEVQWGWDGRLAVPKALWPISHRRFRYRDNDSALVFQDSHSSLPPINLIRDFAPGKFIQHQPRVTGDIPSREGLMRVLLWAALFRNWTLKDWMLLAELGWKPWRKGVYKKNTDKNEIDELIEMLEYMSSTAVMAHSDEVEVEITPTSKTGGGGGKDHKLLQQFLGREMSKAVLGATDVVEEGENGARSATEIRNKRFDEKIETDARRDAATATAQLITPGVRMNYGNGVRPPKFTLFTRDEVDVEQFAGAVEKLTKAKLPLSKKWVYDRLGGGEPEDDDDAIEITFEEEPEGDGSATDSDGAGGADDASS